MNFELKPLATHVVAIRSLTLIILLVASVRRRSAIRQGVVFKVANGSIGRVILLVLVVILAIGVIPHSAGFR